MNTHITIIGINYSPEDSSTGLYTTQMAEFLVNSGFKVEVITGFPYYPQWQIFNSYSSKPNRFTEQINNVTVHRFKQYVPKKPSFLKRILHLLHFTYGSYKNLKKIENTDLIICIVPFTTSVFLGRVLAKRNKAKLWTHIQDFEFDAAFESGVIGKKSFIKQVVFKPLYLFEKWLFNKSDIVSTISNSMLTKLKQKTNSKAILFPNWIDIDFIVPENTKKHKYLASNKFKILYSGNIGAKQDWDFFLQVVDYFKNNRLIEFVVVGSGAKQTEVFEKLKNFENVFCYEPVPYNELPDLLCSASLHVLFQKNTVVDTVMPSKLLGMMASARPSLVTGNLKSEVSFVLQQSQGGKFIDSRDFNSVVKYIENLLEDNVLCNDTGKNARNYVMKKFSKTEILNKFRENVEEILND